MSHKPIDYIVGSKRQAAGYHFETNHYEQYQVICVTAGCLYFDDGHAKTTLGPGMAVTLRIGSAFSLDCGKDGYEGAYVISVWSEGSDFQGGSASGTSTSLMSTLAMEILRISAVPSEYADTILSGLGQALAWEGLRLAPPRPVNWGVGYSEYWARQAERILQANAYTRLTTREVLAPMRFSYRQIARHFKAVHGFSPKAFHTKVKVLEACRLLRGTCLPINAIASELGYASPQHFSTRFREVLGQTPRKFRSDAE